MSISMANESGVIKLRWRWPGDDRPESTITMVISEIKKKGKGLFGINETPSIITNYPDAIEVRGQIVSGPDVNKKILLTMPGYELPENLKVGETVKLSLLNKTTCIGIERRQ